MNIKLEKNFNFKNNYTYGNIGYLLNIFIILITKLEGIFLIFAIVELVKNSNRSLKKFSLFLQRWQ